MKKCILRSFLVLLMTLNAQAYAEINFNLIDVNTSGAFKGICSSELSYVRGKRDAQNGHDLRLGFLYSCPHYMRDGLRSAYLSGYHSVHYQGIGDRAHYCSLQNAYRLGWQDGYFRKAMLMGRFERCPGALQYDLKRSYRNGFYNALKH